MVKGMMTKTVKATKVVKTAKDAVKAVKKAKKVTVVGTDAYSIVENWKVSTGETVPITITFMPVKGCGGEMWVALAVWHENEDGGFENELTRDLRTTSGIGVIPDYAYEELQFQFFHHQDFPDQDGVEV